MKDMKVFAVHNCKGGVGKTTSAANLAYNMASKGKRVLVIDTDPQSNLTPYFTRQNENGKTVRDVFADPVSIDKCIFRTKYKLIDIIKGSTFLTEKDAEQSDDLLKDALNIMSKEYDVVFIDCRPSFEALARNAITAADVLLTPIVLDGYCRDNLSLEHRLYQEITEEHPEHQTEWIVFANKFNNYASHREILEDLVERHDFPLAENCVSERAAVVKASDLRKPLLKHRYNNMATQDFLDLTDELLLGKEG